MGLADDLRAALEGRGDPPDMSGGLPRWDIEILTVFEEYLRLKDSEDEEKPIRQFRGMVPIPRVNIPKQVFGPDYTERDIRELAVERGLGECGYSESAAARLAPEFLETLDVMVDEDTP